LKLFLQEPCQFSILVLKYVLFIIHPCPQDGRRARPKVRAFRTRKKSVNPAQREGEGGPAVRGIEFTSNGGGGGSPSPPSKKAQTDFLRGYQSGGKNIPVLNRKFLCSDKIAGMITYCNYCSFSQVKEGFKCGIGFAAIICEHFINKARGKLLTHWTV